MIDKIGTEEKGEECVAQTRRLKESPLSGDSKMRPLD
jgi:hypothetical protein